MCKVQVTQLMAIRIPSVSMWRSLTSLHWSTWQIALYLFLFKFLYLRQWCDGIINITPSGSAKLGVAREGHFALTDMSSNVLKFFHFILLLLNYSCLHLPPTTPPHPRHAHFPPLLPPLLGFVHVSFIVVPKNPSPLSRILPLSPPTSPLVTINLFLISVSLTLFCLLVCFVDYIPVKGEMVFVWCLSLTTWLISLSIILPSSILAVAKGISSFFLSAV